MENLLNDDVLEQVQEAFQDLKDPVQVLFFGDEENCQYCQETRQLAREVIDTSDKLSLEVYDINADAEIAKKYHVDKTPTLVIAGKDGITPIDYGIRLAGIPSGHEFSSFIQDLLIVSSKNHNLSKDTLSFLESIQGPIHLQVFVTPTCPYCPRAVILAHRLALASDMVQAEMVEATEFQTLSAKYNVSGVPDTSINFGVGKVVGAVPEAQLIQEIKAVLAK